MMLLQSCMHRQSFQSSKAADHLSGDDNGVVESLPVFIQPLHIFFESLTVMEGLPPFTQPFITITPLIAAITAARRSTAVCCCRAGFALARRLVSFEPDGGSIVEEGQLSQAGCDGVWIKYGTARQQVSAVGWLINLSWSGRLGDFPLRCMHVHATD